jgi:hypothetical protein
MEQVFRSPASSWSLRYTSDMERMVRVQSLTLATTLQIAATLQDGHNRGAVLAYEHYWDHNAPDSVQLVSILSGMEVTAFRTWRLQQSLSLSEALQRRSHGLLYRADVQEPTIHAWLERFGEHDPFAGVIRQEMMRTGLDPAAMRTICQEEFGVDRYELLSLVDREQLVLLFAEPGSFAYLTS